MRLYPNPYDEWWQQEDGKYRDAVHFLDGLKLFGIPAALYDINGGISSEFLAG